MSAVTIQRNTNVSQSRYMLIRSDGQWIELPPTFTLPHSRINRRVGVTDRIRSDGGIDTGDWTYDGRKLSLQYSHWQVDPTVYRLSLNVLEGFFQKRFKPYYIVDTAELIRAKIVLTAHDVEENNGNNNQVSLGNAMALEMLDAMWESTVESFYPESGSAGSGAGTGATYDRLDDGDEITITNECEFSVRPIIELKAVDNLESLIFENRTTDTGFEFESADYVAGSLLKFDGTTGAVTLQGSEKSANILSGGPIVLVPGPNVFRYTQSSSGRVDFRAYWRERFAY